ncbi:MAG TPA: type II secretion system protein [Candidatus Xenobia bacterium]
MKGVSLVEFIVALALLAMVFVFMFQLLPYSHIVDHKAWDLGLARDVAHTELEQARAYQIDFLYQMPTTGSTVDPKTDIRYDWTVAASPYPTPVPPPSGCSTPRPDLAEVTVTVNWTETGFSSHGVGGVPRQVVVKTLVARVLPAGGP